LNEAIKDIVLDKELFSREAKVYANDERYPGQSERATKYFKAYADAFANGESVEIIDGDCDDLDEAALSKLMRNIDNLSKGASG